jgi:hypothetical protein
MPLRRLEDRIRDLCAKAIAARDNDANSAISDLKSALREHNARLRKLAAAKLTRLEKPQTRPPLR